MEEFYDVISPWFGNEDCERIITNLELEVQDGRD